MLGANDMETNENGYIRPTSARLDRDYIALARGNLRIVNCPGGRPTLKGYVCAHCGVDFEEENNGFCGQPVKDDGVTPFDATIARRILRDSAEHYEGA
jgi:hypothetical protein